MLSQFDLHGRTALVTGSTRGLGRAMAFALADAGAAIIVNGRDPVAAESTRAELEAAGARAFIALGDVTVREDVERIRDAAVAEFGRIDILVNNAGTCIHGSALEVTDEDWRRVMDTNVDGVWIPSQVIGAHMIEQGGGVMVNIGSISAAIVNRPQWQHAYNASKAAVHHLTQSLAAEWAPLGIRINAIAPGYMATAMAPVDDPKYRRQWIEDAPMQRAGRPEELGGAIVFLASDASSFMTGSILTVDGGYTVF